jgi:hypothetical protein
MLKRGDIDADAASIRSANGSGEPQRLGCNG